MAFNKNKQSELKGSRVDVRGDNLAQAMRILKKNLLMEGLMREVRERQAFEKPSLKRKKAKAAAKKRWQKSLTQQAEE
jgi:small subunit ribosomal protein S21